MKLIIGLALAACAYGQGSANFHQTGVVDAHGANWIPPQATFASPPSSPPIGGVYIFTDDSSSGACRGGGVAISQCGWTGTNFVGIGGSSSGSTVSGSSYTNGTFTSCSTCTVTHGLNSYDVLPIFRDANHEVLGPSALAQVLRVQHPTVNTMTFILTNTISGTWAATGPPTASLTLSWHLLTLSQWANLSVSQWPPLVQ